MMTTTMMTTTDTPDLMANFGTFDSADDSFQSLRRWGSRTKQGGLELDAQRDTDVGCAGELVRWWQAVGAPRLVKIKTDKPFRMRGRRRQSIYARPGCSPMSYRFDAWKFVPSQLYSTLVDGSWHATDLKLNTARETCCATIGDPLEFEHNVEARISPPPVPAVRLRVRLKFVGSEPPRINLDEED